MSKFESLKGETNNIGQLKDLWKNINPEYVARMRLQNEFKTGLDIAKYTASIMRKDMDEYDNDTSKYLSLIHISEPTRHTINSKAVLTQKS